jgi:two-component system sensor histidine kinase UhpB
VEETIERMRNVMAGLRPPVLDDYGLVVALRWYTERFSERTGVTAILQERELSPRLPLVVETELFRIVQEVLTNVSKHANAKHVIITLERMDGVVQLAVSDDGVGFDHSVLRKLENQPRWGLITMEERAKAVGGKVYVKSEPGKGTQIIVQVPC